MLESLHVKNMALIREEEIEPGQGLNILTGETGAGKSLIIGSVNVALGFGNFKDYLTDSSVGALVELLFTTQNPQVLRQMEALDIPAEDGQIVISRRFQGGRTVSRINGETVPIKTVREIASMLIDIHGQHQHQSLLYPSFHMQVVDRYAAEALGTLPDRCTAACRTYRGAQRELANASMEEQQRLKQQDLLQYEIDEIVQARLRPGEDEELETQFRRMANGQRIVEALSEASTLIDRQQGASEQAGRAARLLAGVTSYDPGLEELAGEISQIEDLLSDFGRGLSDYMDDFAYDEQLFQEISQRLDLINHLKAKYGKTIPDILAYLEQSQAEYDKLADYETYLATLQNTVAKAREEYETIAKEISEIRRRYGKELAGKITESLRDLNFLEVQFEVAFSERETPDESGMDEISFLISTNPGMPLRPMGEVASGGELSRIMLGIKSVMADEDAVETLIFDEIDTGISGRTAQKVSEKMAQIAGTHQVICITHLAQIAAMADTHFEIRKESQGGATQTHVRQLTEQESVEELARILGGVTITEAVRQSAGEMRQLAREKKAEVRGRTLRGAGSR